jgi:TRAP-type C4-dicarboxylate transport system permease small subunit
VADGPRTVAPSAPVTFRGRVERVLCRVSSAGAVISGALLLLVMLLTIFDVVQRKYLSSSVSGIIEVSTLLMAFVVYAAVGYTQRSGRHVSMTLVVDRLRPSAARPLHVMGMLVSIVFTAWLVQATGSSAWESFQRTEKSYGAVSFTVWPYRAVVCLGLAVFLIEMVASLLRGEGDKESAEGPQDAAI